MLPRKCNNALCVTCCYWNEIPQTCWENLKIFNVELWDKIFFLKLQNTICKALNSRGSIKLNTLNINHLKDFFSPIGSAPNISLHMIIYYKTLNSLWILIVLQISHANISRNTMETTIKKAKRQNDKPNFLYNFFSIYYHCRV